MLTSHSPDDILDGLLELVSKHLKQRDYSAIPPDEKEKIRNQIKSRLTFDDLRMLQAPVAAKDPLTREMEILAFAFEETLEFSTNRKRIKSLTYPWGWHYEDNALQSKFREFCQGKDKTS